MSELRSLAQRKADVLATLEKNGHAWLATATQDGRPHLVVVAAAWHDERLVIATRGPNPTARNLARGGRGRLGFGDAEDVVMVDADVERTCSANDAGEIGVAFERAVGWNPVDEGPDWTYFVLRPSGIQAYRGYGELEGRHVMKDGRWLA